MASSALRVICAQYLNENNMLLEAIRQNQNLGRLHECVQYQFQLQQNLIFLATYADEHPALQPLHFQSTLAAQADGAPTTEPGAHSMTLDALEQQKRRRRDPDEDPAASPG